MKFFKLSFTTSSIVLFIEYIMKMAFLGLSFFSWFTGCTGGNLKILLTMVLLIGSLSVSMFLGFKSRNLNVTASCHTNDPGSFETSKCLSWLIVFITHLALFTAAMIVFIIKPSYFPVTLMFDASSVLTIVSIIVTVLFFVAYSICIALYFVGYINVKKIKAETSVQEEVVEEVNAEENAETTEEVVEEQTKE